MTHTEIPLLRESEVFARRLIAACRRFGQPRYYFNRQVNWSYRYGEKFYAGEVAAYLADQGAYLSGSSTVAPAVEDIYCQKLRAGQSLVVVQKVFAHWLFRFLGAFANATVRAMDVDIYRKCYVDDIELVFSRTEPRVLRAVFPFPINLKRQIRYIRYLKHSRMLYRLDGNPYLWWDLVRFVLRRDVRSLARMESRAQLRHARSVVGLGVSKVQLSDEFDIGSLDFTRSLARYPVKVVNSAHGVGKYYPMHRYQDFYILTNRQRSYYHSDGACNYVMRQLNDVSTTSSRPEISVPDDRKSIFLVFLSQRFGADGIVAENEARLLKLLQDEFAGSGQVKLFYKPHPNRAGAIEVPGFAVLSNLAEVNGLAGTVFASFYSTCQIDPAFRGRKILVQGAHIHPEIAFDESEEIVNMSELVALVKRAADGLAPVAHAGKLSTA